MPGKDPARGARDTGRSNNGMGGGGRGDKGGGQRNTGSAQGGGLGRSRGGLTGESDTAKKNRERTGFKDPTQGSRDRARGYRPGTLEDEQIPTYNRLPTLGQLGSALSMSPTGPLSAVTALGAVANAAAGADPFGRTPQFRDLDESTGQKPGDYTGGTSNSRNSGRFGSAGNPGNNVDAEAAAEERRKRRLAAQQTALGSDPTSLLGPNVLPI
jgi:hypothetical protein